MTELMVAGAMLVGAVIFAAVRRGQDARGGNQPLGLGVGEQRRTQGEADQTHS